MVKIDLHIHTTASDGARTPEEIVDWAIQKKISIIAITDHDTILGSKKAIDYSHGKKIDIISGIEISCDELELGIYDIHIVGLFVDLDSQELADFTMKMQESRVKQKTKMVELLNKLGYEITLIELKQEAGGGSYGKPHIANILFRKYPDKFSEYNEIFDKLLGNGKKADIHREGVPNIKETINLIHKAGGLAILAHPGYYKKNMIKIMNEFVKSKGDGIEVNCDYRNLEEEFSEYIEDKIKEFAEKHHLVISGGTDFHNMNTHKEIGEYGITKDEFEKLKNKIN